MSEYYLSSLLSYLIFPRSWIISGHLFSSPCYSKCMHIVKKKEISALYWNLDYIQNGKCKNPVRFFTRSSSAGPRWWWRWFMRLIQLSLIYIPRLAFQRRRSNGSYTRPTSHCIDCYTTVYKYRREREHFGKTRYYRRNGLRAKLARLFFWVYLWWMKRAAVWRFTVYQSKGINDVLNEEKISRDGWTRLSGTPLARRPKPPVPVSWFIPRRVCVP